MKSFFKTLSLSLSVFWLSACVIQDMGASLYYQEQKDSCNFSLNRFGHSIRWDRSDFPIVFYIHKSVPEPAHLNFLSAISHWNMSWERFLEDEGLEPFPLFDVAGKRTQYSGSPGNDSYNLLFFTDKFSLYADAGNSRLITQAVTSVFSSPSSGSLRDTDIIVNVDKRLDYFYDESYDQEIRLAQKKSAQNRRLASSKAPAPGFWLRLKQKIQTSLGFLGLFKRKNSQRQIASPFVKIPPSSIDFPSLMIHELGHVPGLAHFGEGGMISARGSTGPPAGGAEKSALKGAKGLLGFQFFNESRRAPASKKRRRGFVSVMEPRLDHGITRRTVTENDLKNLFCGYFGY